MCLLPSSPTSFSSSQPLINAPRPESPDLTPPLLLFLSPSQELIPLILCTACLHPEPKERDQLLHILFNLIKRPDDEQRYAGFFFFPNASDEPVSCADILLRCFPKANDLDGVRGVREARGSHARGGRATSSVLGAGTALNPAGGLCSLAAAVTRSLQWYDDVLVVTCYLNLLPFFLISSFPSNYIACFSLLF